MGFDLSGGSLYVFNDNDKPTLFADNVCGVGDVEFSTEEVAPIYYNLHRDANISFEVNSSDLDVLNQCFETTAPTGNFTLQYQRPIMIQARWHKKARIRKKWLKRFGMKTDTVKVCVYANTLEYHPGHILDEQYNDNVVCATFGSFEFETNKQEYILRPDQKRRGIKIEWQ